MDFFSPNSQYLYDDLVLLPQEGAQTGGTGRPPNSYALLLDGYSVLFDAPFSYLLDEVEDLAERGHPPGALVLSHRDLVGQGDAFQTLQETYDLPVLLHPDDVRAGHNIDFANPLDSNLLKEAGLEVIHFPGHTPGSIMLYWSEHGGVLLAGDSAVAPGPRQALEPPRLERPLGPTQAMTDELAEKWRDFDKPLRTVCPLHGVPYVDRDDLDDIMRSLYEAEPMDPSGG